MTRLFFITFFITFFVADFALAKNDFLLEGNISSYQKILHIVKTGDPTNQYYLGLVDTNPADGITDSMVLIDTNTTQDSKYIEVTDLPTTWGNIKTRLNALTTAANQPDITITQIIKDSQNQNTFYIVGYFPLPLALVPPVPPTYGFVMKFDYSPPNDGGIVNEVVRSFRTENVSVVMDILEVNPLAGQRFVLTGAIFDNEGVSSYSFVDATGAPFIQSIVDKKDILWVGEIDSALVPQRHYIRDISPANTQLMLDTQLNSDDNLTVMGYISGANANNILYVMDLNYTNAATTTKDLQVISQYNAYSLTRDYGNGVMVDLTQQAFLGSYLEVGTDAEVLLPTGTLTIPLANTTYTTNVPVQIRVNYMGRNTDPLANAWDYLDINCSAPIGHASIDTNAVYIINFPLARLPANCQPPKFEYYVSDKTKAFIDLQWEWIYEKKDPIIWDRSYPKFDTVNTSRILHNTFFGADYNFSRTTVLHNQETENPRQFTLFQINNGDRGNIVWDKQYPSVEKNTTIAKGSGFVQDLNGAMMFLGSVLEGETSATNVNTTECVFIKIDQYGNELYEQYIGNFWDDECTEVAVEKQSQRPLYSEYVAIGSTFSTNAQASEQGWAIKLRDSGVLIDLHYQWNLIGNPTDRKISAAGSKEGQADISLEALGAHKYYFSFQDNQWLMNKTPIEPLDGFFLVSYDNSQQIFLQGNLLEQDFQEIQSGETGWVMLTTGKVVKNPKAVYDLYAVYVYRNGQYQSNPILIEPGEGFWAKKYR